MGRANALGGVRLMVRSIDARAAEARLEEFKAGKFDLPDDSATT
jgi:hypothetical protein